MYLIVIAEPLSLCLILTVLNIRLELDCGHEISSVLNVCFSPLRKLTMINQSAFFTLILTLSSFLKPYLPYSPSCAALVPLSDKNVDRLHPRPFMVLFLFCRLHDEALHQISNTYEQSTRRPKQKSNIQNTRVGR